MKRRPASILCACFRSLSKNESLPLRGREGRARKRSLLFLLPLLLLLQSCGALAPDDGAAAQPLPPPPGIPEYESTEPTVLPEPPETAPSEPSERQDPPAESTEPSVPDEEPPAESPEPPEQAEATDPKEKDDTEPPGYPPGDTTPTWRPGKAADYPADASCGDLQLLEKWMAVEGLRFDDLDARGCDQLILTVAQPGDGTRTLTILYERGPEGSFVPVSGRMQGWVGKNGVMHDRRRNSDTSPAGLWALGTAFGNDPKPSGLKLPWRQVTPNSDWVCDEESPYFNTWQERDDPDLTPWSDDVEHLEDYPRQYAYACVIEFNRPPDAVPSRGCAIFLHCADGPTAGCVGLLREDMLAVLRWLDAEKNPYILITGRERP